MCIGIFSGSFNPIHIGHTRLAAFILQHTELDAIWLLVSPSNPLKDEAGLLPEELRLQMARLAVANMPGVEASDFEFGLPRPSYTIVTLRALRERYPEHTFSLLIGSDNMARFDQWYCHDELLREFPVYVYPREGDDMAALCRRFPTMHVLPAAPLLPISATQIRQEICCGTYNQEWLHPQVADFLKKNTILLANMKNK